MIIHPTSLLVLTTWLMLAGLTSVGWSHPPGADDEEHAGISHRTFALPDIDGEARPWSDQPVLNDDGRFHFAVMTDRTGGHRPGIWMQGVETVNLLRPEFVVSVGDLIEGYTEDVDSLQRQWQEFLGFIDEMEMRFFFVAGNHDVTNPTMHRIWREKFGREWYSFDYQGVHFICLSSEDPSASLGEEQLDWLLDDLAQNEEARWTFVFLHKPLWVYSERAEAAGNPDRTNWKQVEAALGSRPHTVFAGHVHHYVQYQRGDHEYYHLATLGGGSRLRGTEYGEFDHVMWVTMEEDGPQIANILLDGVLQPDAVTEESIARFRKFLSATHVRVDPILIQPSVGFDSAKLQFTVTNEFEEEIQVEASPSGLPLRGLTLVPDEIEGKVAPHDSRQFAFTIEFAQPLDLEHFSHAAVDVKAHTTSETAPLVVDRTEQVLIDQRHYAPQEAVEIDGQLDEWEGPWESFSDSPKTFGASQQWQGPGDASARFRVAHDRDHLYFSGIVRDDVVLADGDRLTFRLDGRAMEERLSESRLGDHSLTVVLRPKPDGESRVSFVRDGDRDQRQRVPAQHVAVKPTDVGYVFEFAVPSSFLTDAQGSSWNSFQMNVALRDIDESSDERVSILWRPVAELRKRNTGYAHFFAGDGDQ